MGRLLAPEEDPAIWNAVAHAYARDVEHVITGTFAPEVTRLAAIRRGEHVLDIATGPGSAAIEAAKAGAQVMAVDICPNFVDMARRRIREAGLDTVEVKRMDGHALDVEDGAFDAAVSNFGVFLFPDRQKGFREAYRVVKPGGRAAFTAFATPPADGWAAFIRGAVKRTFPDLPPAPPVKFLELADPALFRRELEEAGFRDVQVETVERTTSWPDAASAWSGLTEGAPMFRPLLDRIGEDGRGKLRATFDAMAEERFGSGAPLEFQTPVHVALARKAA